MIKLEIYEKQLTGSVREARIECLKKAGLKFNYDTLSDDYISGAWAVISWLNNEKEINDAA